MSDTLFVAQNIINQIGDLWAERMPDQRWVEVRQATNDQLDQFVSRLIADNVGPAASCHLCVGAGGYEDHDGEWAECSCQRAALSADAIRKVLVEHGLGQGGELHGWRCGYPDTYGPCDCLDELVTALAEL